MRIWLKESSHLRGGSCIRVGTEFLGAGQGSPGLKVLRGTAGCILAPWSVPSFQLTTSGLMNIYLRASHIFLKFYHTHDFVGAAQLHGVERLAVIPNVIACSSRLPSSTNTSAGNSIPTLL